MIMLGKLADRVLARFVPKTHAAASGCYTAPCPSAPEFNALCCYECTPNCGWVCYCEG